MSKYFPNIEEFKSLDDQGRKKHINQIAVMKYIAFFATIVLGLIYAFNEGLSGINTVVGIASGAIGFILLGSSRSPKLGLFCCVLAIGCAAIHEYVIL